MSREVVWTKSRYELICEEGMLNDLDREMLKEHIQLMSRQEMAIRHHCDIGVIDDAIRRYKAIYDAVQREYPDKLDKRDKSVYKKAKNG